MEHDPNVLAYYDQPGRIKLNAPTSVSGLTKCAYRREWREKRLQRYREEIRQIALYLRAEQVSLTQRHIGRYLAQPAILRDPKVRELLREVCRQIEKGG